MIHVKHRPGLPASRRSPAMPLARVFTPTNRTIVIVPIPSADSNTIRARQTSFCGVFRPETNPSSVARSAGDSQIGPEEFAEAVGGGVSRETLDRLGAYEKLLKTWQTRVNLVGTSTLDTIWHRHFYDSAQLLPYLPPDPCILADIGSGAGFPGLVLAILSSMEVHLVESDQKKAIFLREAARITETAVTVHDVRAEKIENLQADVVTARALASLPKVIEYAVPLLAEGGICLFSRGRTFEEELTATREIWHMSVKSFRSRTDESGAILRIGALSRVRIGNPSGHNQYRTGP